jgi:hypothetical protein
MYFAEHCDLCAVIVEMVKRGCLEMELKRWCYAQMKITQLREKASKIYLGGATAYIRPSHFWGQPDSGSKASDGPATTHPFWEQFLASATASVRPSE